MKLKLISIAAAALFAAAPVLASTPVTIDFEKAWAYGEAVDSIYSSLGVTFTNILGLSNGDGLGSLLGGAYYANAPTPMGVAYAQLDGVVNTAAYMNVADGVDGGLSFYYSSVSAVSGAVKAYSGLNGTGTLLGSFDLSATDSNFSVWNKTTFAFSGKALSFDLTNTAGVAGLDNITTAVPEPETFALLLAGLGLVGAVVRRKQKNST